MWVRRRQSRQRLPLAGAVPLLTQSEKASRLASPDSDPLPCSAPRVAKELHILFLSALSSFNRLVLLPASVVRDHGSGTKRTEGQQ